ncbi:MAG: hypothetical protein JWQ87_2040 [Candidatus Sulfotelmatobacter sp.]|nr:hypothetical protein [Candidatus Sulfotelmatobacter sp.]
MTEELVAPAQIEVLRWNDGDEQLARVTSKEIDVTLSEIARNEHDLAHNWVRLGELLLRVRSKQFWLLWADDEGQKFKSFSAYIQSLHGRVHKGRTQLYHAVGVAEKLLPFVSAEQLQAMGISKATVLKEAVAQTGRRPSEAMIAKAVDPEVGIEELEATVFEEQHVKPAKKMRYWKLGGFYVTPDEKKEIEHAFDIARRTDPVIPKSQPDWAQLKECVQRMAREYLATYEQIVMQGEG